MVLLVCAVTFVFLIVMSPFAHGTSQYDDPCDRCHLESDYTSLKPVHEAQLCLECHEGQIEDASTVTALCLYCHGKNGDTSSPLEQPPASGDFYYVTASVNYGDGYGHNVEANNPDDRLGNRPPGGKALNSQLKCTDCHDPHGNDNYRNLGYDITAGVDVSGLEHDQWEIYNTSSTNHNVYKSGIADFCLKCHSMFGKAKNNGGGIIRHPYDVEIVGKIPPTALYGRTGEEYNPMVTLVLVEDPTATNPTTQTITSSSRVFCLSCHRAHAWKYIRSTRWDPTENAQPDKGCNVCHKI